MCRAVLLLLALLGCAQRSLGPTVVVHLVTPADWSTDDRRMLASVGSVWRELGLGWVVTESHEASDELCERHWAQVGSDDCNIDVALMKDVLPPGVEGLTVRDRGQVWIDESVRRYVLLHVVAHEMGHIVFDSSTHVDAGIMARASTDYVPTAEDLELACRTIHRGC